MYAKLILAQMLESEIGYVSENDNVCRFIEMGRAGKYAENCIQLWCGRSIWKHYEALVSESNLASTQCFA